MSKLTTDQRDHARFNQVEGVDDDDRDAAWKKIKAAAKTHGVELHEKSWRDIGRH